ncbi:MAG: hypothetical protein ACJAXE_000932 [Neolewinella sp.]
MKATVEDYVSVSELRDVPFAGFVQVGIYSTAHQALYPYRVATNVTNQVRDHSGSGNNVEPLVRCGGFLTTAEKEEKTKKGK